MWELAYFPQSFPNSNLTVFNAYAHTVNFSCVNFSSKRKNVKPSAKSPNRTFTIGFWLINLLPLSPKPPYADFVGLQNMTLTLPWLVCRVITACCCDLVELNWNWVIIQSLSGYKYSLTNLNECIKNTQEQVLVGGLITNMIQWREVY